MFRTTCKTITALVCLALAAGEAHAIWSKDGSPVSVRDQDQRNPQLVSDGTGGMIVAWADARDDGVNYYAYVQRMDGSGLPVWSPADGFSIDGYGDPDTEVIDVVSDGANGAIVVWTTFGGDLQAQRVDAGGHTLWREGGLDFSGSAEGFTAVATADGAGGVIVAWVGPAGTPDNIYAQRVDANGAWVWTPGGLPVFSVTSVVEPCIIPDGSGGALISATSGSGPSAEIRVQRVYASGNLWIPDARPGGGQASALATDGAGGAYVVWRAGSDVSRTIAVHLINGQGSLPWGSRVAISPVFNPPGEEMAPVIIDDGAGNAVACWQEDRIENGDVFAQKIDAFGTALWTTDGARVSLANEYQQPMRILPGSGSNLIVITSTPDTLLAQAIDVSGASRWGTGGTRVLNSRVPDNHDVATDGAGGVLAAIGDDRSGMLGDIYGVAINSLGKVYRTEPAIDYVLDVPGDQGGWVRMRIRYSDRDDLAITEARASRYDVWREVPPAMASELRRAAASHAAIAPHGITLFEAGGKQYLEAPQGVVFPVGTWELLGGFNATQAIRYNYVAPTFADSSGSGFNSVNFVVSVHTTDPAVWFVGLPESGYSVDNIAPAVPTGMAVAYNSGGGNQLTWDPSPDNDFQYFRIYRDMDPGFTPSPANYVHGSIGTQWLDPVADGWQFAYKITAVDGADNESDPTGGTATGIRQRGTPARITLGQNIPNPFNPATTIQIGIPAAGHVALRVYDVSGRRVHTLVDGPLPAGFRTFTWNGRDARGRPVASGMYFYRMTTEGFDETRKMLLLK